MCRVVRVDQQHLRAVAGDGQRDVERGHGAVFACAGADHGHDRRAAGSARGEAGAHLADGVKELPGRQVRSQRGPSHSCQVGGPAGGENSAQAAHHVGWLQPRNRRLLDRRDRRRRRFDGSMLGTRRRIHRARSLRLPARGIGRHPVGGNDPSGGGEAAEHQADHRQQAHGRRKDALPRFGGFADDACARSVQAFLFLGLARALQEREVDVAAGLDVAFKFAKPDRGLAELNALALLRSPAPCSARLRNRGRASGRSSPIEQTGRLPR